MTSQSTVYDARVSHVEAQLSLALAPAIFIPFRGFDNSTSVQPLKQSSTPQIPASLDPVSKLERILQFLPMQQDVVRAQIIALVLEEIEEMKVKARTELERTKAGDENSLAAEDKEAERISKLEVEEMFRRIKASARPCKSHELLLEKKFLDDFWRLPQKPRKDLDGDIEMGATIVKPKTPRQIRERLALDLQVLIKGALDQLDQYDIHCNSVIQPYRSSMARKTGGSVTVQAAPGPNPADAERWKRSSQSSPENSINGNVGTVSRAGVSNDVVRLSNGMPVSMERQPVRNMESLEALARRSKS